MKKLMMSLTLTLLSSVALANGPEFVMKTVELQGTKQIRPYTRDEIAAATTGGSFGGGILGTVGGVGAGGEPSTLETVGKVIQTASTVVAFGQDVYNLVQKGKPSNVTEYAPISTVPKDPTTKEAVSPFDMEDCSMPVQRKFKTTMTSMGISEVVSFEYMVVYTHSCSFNGVGKYIQSIVIIPTRVKTEYGWDFNASMKLTGMMNHGKKADPIVGALLTMKYTMSNWKVHLERNDTVHVTGAGALKVLQ